MSQPPLFQVEQPVTARQKFERVLVENGLQEWFVREFGTDYESKFDHKEGWHFSDGRVSYRACDLFNDYADGYNWRFERGDATCEFLLNCLAAAGFEVSYNAGDEEDGLLMLQALALP